MTTTITMLTTTRKASFGRIEPCHVSETNAQGKTFNVIDSRDVNISTIFFPRESVGGDGRVKVSTKILDRQRVLRFPFEVVIDFAWGILVEVGDEECSCCHFLCFCCCCCCCFRSKKQ